MASKTLEKLKHDMETERYYHVAAIAAAEERIKMHKERIEDIDKFFTAVEEELE